MDVEHRAWLVMCAGDDREHGGNDGYADLPESSYLWDSTVGNASRIRVGHKIVLRNKKTLLGVSVIEHIEVGEASKTTYKCPRCKRAHINARATKTPRYKCYDSECQELFDDPLRVHKQVVTYRSHHGAGWVDLQGRLSGKQLHALCTNRNPQLSLRELRWQDFLHELGDGLPQAQWQPLERTAARIAGGHQERTVRARIGQSPFRQRLLGQGDDLGCAFTGPAPAAVLEAAHLYSYAAEGEHYQDGGLLMRRDVHALFDKGLLAVDPSTWTIAVSPQIRDYDAYGPLHAEPLQTSLMPAQQAWLRLHWDKYRVSRTEEA